MKYKLLRKRGKIRYKRRNKKYILLHKKPSPIFVNLHLCTARDTSEGVKNILVFSSLIFSTNIIISFIYKNYVYSCLFVFLTITSVIYHSNTNNYTNILDKIGIFLVVSYGIYVLHSKYDINKFFIVSIIFILFLLTMFLYIYGYFTKQFCFHNQLSIGNKYHSLLHCISSLAQHLIIIM
jgi:hypothetical protein